ncbi:MAG: hypothetical protein ACUVRD_02585 [Bacteroidia bacterium]
MAYKKLLWGLWVGGVGLYALWVCYTIYEIGVTEAYGIDPGMYLAGARSFVEHGDFWIHSMDPSMGVV